jgi:biopolymer transport protein ExbD
MKIKRIREAKKARIEIIPMIDVMFFLLAAFILTSLFMQSFSGINVNLTKGRAEKVSSDNKITISINKDNIIFLNQNQILFEALGNEVNKLIKNKEETIIIACDQDVRQGFLMQVILEIRKVGIHHFSLIARQ